MGDIATNTNQQIQKLKSRGMDLDMPEKKIKEILLDIGYYRLGFYWKHFELDNDHNFKPNTKFSDVILLYYLDVDLRSTLLKFLNRIEIHFRTKVIYYVSNKYKQSPSWFADINIVNENFVISTPTKLSMLNRVYNKDFIKNNKSLKKHHLKNPNDNYAPAWKVIEFFTFGVLLNLFKNIKDNDIKQRVTESMGVLNVKKFENLMSTVVLIRNICSHGDVLYDFKTPKALSVLPGIDFVNSDRSSFNACLKVISYFLKHISTNRENEFKENIKHIIEKKSENIIIKKIIEEQIRYL